jgi:hypothetical protein
VGRKTIRAERLIKEDSLECMRHFWDLQVKSSLEYSIPYNQLHSCIMSFEMAIENPLYKIGSLHCRSAGRCTRRCRLIPIGSPVFDFRAESGVSHCFQDRESQERKLTAPLEDKSDSFTANTSNKAPAFVKSLAFCRDMQKLMPGFENRFHGKRVLRVPRMLKE